MARQNDPAVGALAVGMTKGIVVKNDRGHIMGSTDICIAAQGMNIDRPLSGPCQAQSFRVHTMAHSAKGTLGSAGHRHLTNACGARQPSSAHGVSYQLRNALAHVNGTAQVCTVCIYGMLRHLVNISVLHVLPPIC